MDKLVFKELFNTFFDPIRNYVYYRCADEEVASDIAQDVFMRVWEKREQIQLHQIKALLYKMANDMVISHYRRQVIELNYEKDIHPDGEVSSPEEELQFAELKKKYAAVLAGMSDKERETFLMSRNEELKYHEIAERLGISIKTVEKRMSTALKLLKQLTINN